MAAVKFEEDLLAFVFVRQFINYYKQSSTVFRIHVQIVYWIWIRKLFGVSECESRSRFLMTKNFNKVPLQKTSNFVERKYYRIYLFLVRPPWRTSKLQHFKAWISSLFFFLFCGSWLPSRIRIPEIQLNRDWIRILNTDKKSPFPMPLNILRRFLLSFQFTPPLLSRTWAYV